MVRIRVGDGSGRHMAVGRVRGFTIATQCKTLDELIARYRDRVDERSILVPAVEGRDIGSECAFAILLADKQVALAGTCKVLERYRDANNPFGRPGMRLGIQRLGPESERVFARLVASRTPPRTSPRAVAARGASSDDSVQRQRKAAVARAPDARRVASVDVRAPSSPHVLPANPLSSLTDASLEGLVDSTLHEDTLPAPPEVFPTGTREALETLPSEVTRAARPTQRLGPVASAARPPRTRLSSAPSAAAPRAAKPTQRLGPAAKATPRPTTSPRLGPLPLPLPPPPDPVKPRAPAPIVAEPSKLDVDADGDRERTLARSPLAPPRRRLARAAAVALVALIGAGAAFAYTQLGATGPAVVEPAIAAPIASAELSFQLAAQVDPPPPAPPEPPPPMHAVLVRTQPIAARVTVGDRYFGTTPTYIKVPAHTPVEVRIERPGFAPVTVPLVSKTRTDRVFVRLHAQRAKR